jgi:hypothetical protein
MFGNMHAKPIYTHNLAGRRPIMALVLFAGGVMIALGLHYQAPLYFHAPAALAISMALWAIVANPQTGMTLTARTLHFYNRHHKRDIRVSDIASVVIDRDMDGGPHASMVLKSGEKVHIPAMCMTRDLGSALRTLGIAVNDT